MVTRIRSITIEQLLGHPLNDIESKYAPPSVFASGAIDIPLRLPRVSIVGTRHASEVGLARAREIATLLTKRNVIVVSGLARGIDTAAHRAAIESNGKTIAVLGTPLYRYYPPENAELQELIMRDHLAISQFDLNHATRPQDFVIRNRTMALISDATVIIEAGESSGALSQGWETLRLGRPLYIAEDAFSKQLRWPTEMAKYGAKKLQSLDELLDELPLPDMDYVVPW
ncbi:MAG: DNA-processing protein DprA [Conexivisphaerales archaeon]